MIELAAYAVGYAIGLYLVYSFVLKPIGGRVRRWWGSSD